MLKPRGLGKGLPNAPTLFRHSQTIPGKKHKQNQSLSGFHVIVICFRLSKRIQVALSDNSRQNQAESGNFRQNQAFFRHFQAKSGRIRQNQAESGKIRQTRATHWIWKIIGQGPMLFQEPQTVPPFWAEFFWVHSIKIKAQANYNQTSSNGIILPKTWQLC